MLGTKEKRKKSSLPPKTQNLKENKARHLECMLSLPIGYMKFLFPKLFVTILAWANTPIVKGRGGGRGYFFTDEG
jgi:hypothetical protein